MTLAGNELTAGQAAPEFTLHYFDNGMQKLTRGDLIGKPSLISVVPSLDTGVCAIQTRKFNERLAEMGEAINALTVSVDLPFAQARFCGENKVTHLRSASDYMNRNFGKSWGMLIEELQLLARGVFVLDSDGTIVHAETVGEVTSEPDYDSALSALENCHAKG